MDWHKGMDCRESFLSSLIVVFGGRYCILVAWVRAVWVRAVRLWGLSNAKSPERLVPLAPRSFVEECELLN